MPETKPNASNILHMMTAANKPTFSIVIDNYNHERFLEQAIDSCLTQTLKAHEIIIVDDGSTDSSRNLLKKYEEISHVKIILQENQGLEAALQKGFDHCTGDWLLGLDADDYYLPDCLKTLAAVLHEDVSLIYFRAHVIDVTGRISKEVVPQGPLHSKGDMVQSQIVDGFHHSFPPQSFNCYPLKFLREFQIYPHEVVSMKKEFSCDRYLQFQAVLKGNIVPVDCILGAYRIHDSGHTTQKRTDLTKLRKSLHQHDLVLLQVKKQLEPLHLKIHPSFQFDHYYWFYRMLCLVTDPSKHTHPEDTRFFLLKMNLISQWKASRRYPFTEKSINYFKLILMFLLPVGFFFRIYLFRPKYKLARLIRSLKERTRS